MRSVDKRECSVPSHGSYHVCGCCALVLEGFDLLGLRRSRWANEFDDDYMLRLVCSTVRYEVAVTHIHLGISDVGTRFVTSPLLMNSVSVGC